MAISLAGTGVFTALAAWTPSNALAIGCISVAMFLCYVSTATAWAMASVAAPANCTASLGAMQNFGGYLGGALAPTDDRADRQSNGSSPRPCCSARPRAGLRGGLCDDHQGPDPGGRARPAGGDGTGGIAVPAPATHALRFHRAVVGYPSSSRTARCAWSMALSV